MLFKLTTVVVMTFLGIFNLIMMCDSITMGWYAVGIISGVAELLLVWSAAHFLNVQ